MEVSMGFNRIAAVSTDGIHINDHFGKADRFLIYDLDDKLSWVEDRTAEPLSSGDPNHTFDPDKFERVFNVIKDCNKVYVTKIGETPAAKLKALGIEPVLFQGRIADIVG
jgi:predicted Fe-Mo cluster-binding NifX family protein